MPEIVPIEERFTPAAAAAWTAAQHHADQLGHEWLGTEHLLLGILAAPEDPATRLLMEYGATAARIRVRMQGLRGRRPTDADLLASLGIDLKAVREHVTTAFGAGAVDQLYRRRRGWGRRPPAWGPLCGRRLMPRLKRALGAALDSAARGGRDAVDIGDLMSGLLSVEDGMAVEILRAEGVDTAGLHAQLRSSVSRR